MYSGYLSVLFIDVSVVKCSLYNFGFLWRIFGGGIHTILVNYLVIWGFCSGKLQVMSPAPTPDSKKLEEKALTENHWEILYTLHASFELGLFFTM